LNAEGGGDGEVGELVGEVGGVRVFAEEFVELGNLTDLSVERES
jgi:hypothetical protein